MGCDTTNEIVAKKAVLGRLNVEMEIILHNFLKLRDTIREAYYLASTKLDEIDKANQEEGKPHE